MRFALSFALEKAAKMRPDKTAIIPIETRSSTRVKPRDAFLIQFLLDAARACPLLAVADLKS